MSNNPIISNNPPAVQNPQVMKGSINSTWSQVRQLSDGSQPGNVLGQSAADEIAFFGGTPVPQILQGSLAGSNGLLKIYTSTQSPSAVSANTTAEYAMTVSGVLATDMVIAAIKPTSQAGLAVGTARVSAASTVNVSFANLTGSPITPTASEAWVIVVASAALQYPAVTLSPAAVPANTTVDQDFTVVGVQVGMTVSVTKPTLQAGLLIAGARVVAPNTVGVTFMNVTASPITPTAAEAYLFFGARGLRLQPVMQTLTMALSPAAVAANTTAEQTFTVTGLIAGTAVAVDKPGVTTGIALVGARVSAANTLALNFANTTAASITPPSETYTIGFFPNVAPAAGSVNTQLAEMGVEAGRALSYYGMLSADTTP